MDRRSFLKTIATGLVAAGSPELALAGRDMDKIGDRHVKDYLTKIKNYNHHFEDDVILNAREFKLLKQVANRLTRIQRTVGYANFSLIDIDYAMRIARNYSRVGDFPREEIEFLERVFYTNANDYGFFGEKVITHFTESVSSRDTKKISGSGHYLFRGKPEKLYKKISKDLNHNVVLTSGVRGLVKQMHLFLKKAVDSKGNLSMASRSLAPPGHSFHGIGDFDVGKRGFGYRNFTEDFAHTDEFKRLSDLGYINIRYHEKNPFGVRFEPWHIKVV